MLPYDPLGVHPTPGPWGGGGLRGSRGLTNGAKNVIQGYFGLKGFCCPSSFSKNRVFLNLWFAKPMVCVRVAFHENCGNHENDENDEDNSDSYKQGVECWIHGNHGNHENDENHGNPGCKPRVPQTTGLEIPSKNLWKSLKTSENLWKALKSSETIPLRGPLRDPLRGRFPSQNLSGLLPLIVLPLHLSPRSASFATLGTCHSDVSSVEL